MGAWGGEGFLVATHDPANRPHVRALCSALAAGELTVFLTGSNNPFQVTGGLTLARWSMIPDEAKAAWRASIADRIALGQADEATRTATGIDALLDTAGLTRARRDVDWHAHRMTSCPSSHPVVYFIIGDAHNVCGWYTVEEIETYCRAGAGRMAEETSARAAERADSAAKREAEGRVNGR